MHIPTPYLPRLVKTACCVIPTEHSRKSRTTTESGKIGGCQELGTGEQVEPLYDTTEHTDQGQKPYLPKPCTGGLFHQPSALDAEIGGL